MTYRIVAIVEGCGGIAVDDHCYLFIPEGASLPSPWIPARVKETLAALPSNPDAATSLHMEGQSWTEYEPRQPSS